MLYKMHTNAFNVCFVVLLWSIRSYTRALWAAIHLGRFLGEWKFYSKNFQFKAIEPNSRHTFSRFPALAARRRRSTKRTVRALQWSAIRVMPFPFARIESKASKRRSLKKLRKSLRKACRKSCRRDGIADCESANSPAVARGSRLTTSVFDEYSSPVLFRSFVPSSRSLPFPRTLFPSPSLSFGPHLLPRIRSANPVDCSTRLFAKN